MTALANSEVLAIEIIIQRIQLLFEKPVDYLCDDDQGPWSSQGEDLEFVDDYHHQMRKPHLGMLVGSGLGEGDG